MKKIVIGILAHVDAGKTTLSESMLYLAGEIRHHGRVDHHDTFLDFDTQERQRGITIFSKQAQLNWKNTQMIFIDTPGHVDFSPEMERTLQILDYAIVVINGNDGVQSHSETIWQLLKHYHIPTFIFMNKMDITPFSSADLLKMLQQKFHESCLDFTQPLEQLYESIALIDDCLLEEYMNQQSLTTSSIAYAIKQRQLFPVYFGSALKNEGVRSFLDLLDTYALEPEFFEEFAALVYKISHDPDGHRLTHMKITGGSLKVKEKINDEKVDQIRIYDGQKYMMVQEAYAGDVIAVKGLKTLTANQSLGKQPSIDIPHLSSYMNYRVVLSPQSDRHLMLQRLRQLADEEPTLHVSYHQTSQDIHVQLMGEMQIDILKNIIQERFHETVDFDEGQILYKETIQETVEGVGHFEPLRHYAEVHVLLEPLPLGSGLVFESQCSQDHLPLHYQRLILTHFQEKEHIGVLTGSPITDMKISLLDGKAHQKHTEGGDFREATYRAIRQGLKKAKSILLEPYYHCHIQVPRASLSRLLYDMENMHCQVKIDSENDAYVFLKGEGPVAVLQNYQREMMTYSKGQGRLMCTFKGYFPCQQQDQIIETLAYHSENDQDNPTGSIFCQHGAGFYVSWDQVENYMHIPYRYQSAMKTKPIVQTKHYQNEDEELDDIFTRTYGPIKRRLADDMYRSQEPVVSMSVKVKPECLLVDGYNVIHSWPQLKELAQTHLAIARDRLIDILSNYQGYKQCLMIIVFDAYKVKQNRGSITKNHQVYVVYTKEAQTADMYIERVTHQLASEYRVVVATSDALEQTIVIGRGARRMSSRELALEVEAVSKNHLEEFLRKQPRSHEFLLEDVQKYEKDFQEETHKKS